MTQKMRAAKYILREISRNVEISKRDVIGAAAFYLFIETQGRRLRRQRIAQYRVSSI
jgi:hypothetical protein